MQEFIFSACVYLKYKKISKYIIINILVLAKYNCAKILCNDYFNKNQLPRHKDINKLVYMSNNMEYIKKLKERTGYVNFEFIGKYSDESFISSLPLDTNIFDGMCVSKKNRLIAHKYVPYRIHNFLNVAKSGNIELIKSLYSNCELYYALSNVGYYYALHWGDIEFYTFLRQKNILYNKNIKPSIKIKKENVNKLKHLPYISDIINNC